MVTRHSALVAFDIQNKKGSFVSRANYLRTALLVDKDDCDQDHHFSHYAEERPQSSQTVIHTDNYLQKTRRAHTGEN